MAASAIVSHINLNPTFSTRLSSSSSLSPYPALPFPKFNSSPLSLAVKPKPLTRHIQGLSPLSSSPLIARAIPSSSAAPDSTTRQIFHALTSPKAVFVFELSSLRHTLMRIARASSSSSPTPSPFAAASCYVVGDNIDTDQKNPVDCLTDELEGSDSCALSGLPPDKKKSKFPIVIDGLCFVVGDNIESNQIVLDEYDKHWVDVIDLPLSYPNPFIELGQKKSKYSIVIAGSNFGHGSSHELDPALLRASGVVAVVAESYARRFFRNSVASGEFYPLESEMRLCGEFKTGDVVTLELAESLLINCITKKEYKLKPPIGGDAAPVVETGGRQNGKMIPSHWSLIVVVVMLLAFLLPGQRKISITNIINDHRQSFPKITSIENRNWFGVSINNGKGNVGQ